MTNDSAYQAPVNSEKDINVTNSGSESEEGSTSPMLESLPDPPLIEQECPPRARMQLDLLLLAIEALQLGGSEEFLTVAKELSLDGIIANRVTLWQMRSANPWRRHSQRRTLSWQEGKALVVTICHLSRRLTFAIRQLLGDYQKLKEKQIPYQQHLRISQYLERFRAHYRSRMNPRRSAVAAYSSDERLNELAMSLLSQLLFCTGTYGMQRLWMSLFEGEV
jgi:hypothetical protein